jgi:alanine racemase
VWAVVKADGYGHGAVPVAETALAAGASGLCVALVQEGVELRRAGVQGQILVLTEQPLDQVDELVAHRLTPAVCTVGAVSALVRAVGAHRFVGYRVHVKVDTGMHRMGAQPEDVPVLLDAIAASGGALRLGGVFTHLACADEPDHPSNSAQLARLDEVVAAARAAGHRPEVVHAANSAAALALPAARHDLVRSGIALYGIVPGDGVAGLCTELRPALSLRARVSRVARVSAGSGVSYGLRTVLDRDATIVTVPVGYADGVPRRLWQTGVMLVGGVRRPIVGVVTMDQVMLDCGDDDVAVGDEVVLLGRQGDDEIRAEDWAEQLGTIGYEIVCGISRRIGRRHHRR